MKQLHLSVTISFRALHSLQFFARLPIHDVYANFALEPIRNPLKTAQHVTRHIHCLPQRAAPRASFSFPNNNSVKIVELNFRFIVADQVFVHDIFWRVLWRKVLERAADEQSLNAIEVSVSGGGRDYCELIIHGKEVVLRHPDCISIRRKRLDLRRASSCKV